MKMPAVGRLQELRSELDRAAAPLPRGRVADLVALVADGFATAFGVTSGGGVTVDEVGVETAMAAVTALYTSPGTVGTALVLPGGQGTGASALFVGELLNVLHRPPTAPRQGGPPQQHPQLSAVWRWGRGMKRRALATLDAVIAREELAVLRSLTPGIASRLIKVVAHGLRANGVQDRVAADASGALALLLNRAFAALDEGEKTQLSARLSAAVSPPAVCEAEPHPAADDDAGARDLLSKVVRGYLTRRGDTPCASGAAAPATASTPAGSRAGPAPGRAGTYWPDVATPRLAQLVEPLLRTLYSVGTQHALRQDLGAAHAPDDDDGVFYGDLFADFNPVDASLAPSADEAGRSGDECPPVARLLQLAWACTGVAVTADAEGTFACEAVTWLCTQDRESACVQSALDAIAVLLSAHHAPRMVVGLRGAEAASYDALVHAMGTRLADQLVSQKDASVAAFHGFVAVAGAATASNALRHAHRMSLLRCVTRFVDRHGAKGRLGLELSPTHDAMVESVLRGFLVSPSDGTVAGPLAAAEAAISGELATIVDDWDLHHLHAAACHVIAALLRVAHAAAEERSRLQAGGVAAGDSVAAVHLAEEEVAEIFVFGGAWEAAWRLVRQTRHIWQISHRWSECSVQQRQHRAHVLATAFSVVRAASGCVGSAYGDTGTTWLCQVAYAVVAECANPLSEAVMHAAVHTLQYMGVALGHPGRAFAETTLKERREAAAALLTSCADYVVDAVLLALPVAETNYVVAEEWRPAPQQELDLAGISEGEAFAGDTGSQSVAALVACYVAEAFMLVVTDAATDAEPAVALRDGEVLTPFLEAVIGRISSFATDATAAPEAAGALKRGTPALLGTVRAAARYVAAVTRAFEAALFAQPKAPTAIPAPKDGSLPEPSLGEYDRCFPAWLARAHAALRAALLASLPLALASCAQGVDGPVASEASTARRMAVVRLAATVADALSSNVPTVRVGDAPTGAEGGDEADAPWPPEPRPPRRFSDNYLPIAFRLFTLLSRVVEATTGSTSLQTQSVVRRVHAAAQKFRTVREDPDSTEKERRESAFEAKHVLTEVARFPLACDATVVKAIDAGADLLRLAPSFLVQRMRDAFADAVLLQWLRYVTVTESAVGAALAAKLHESAEQRWTAASRGSHRAVEQQRSREQATRAAAEAVSGLFNSSAADDSSIVLGGDGDGAAATPSTSPVKGVRDASVASDAEPRAPPATEPRRLRGKQLRAAIARLLQVIRESTRDDEHAPAAMAGLVQRAEACLFLAE